MNKTAIYSDKRKSGIRLIGDLSWGSHFCQFYDTQSDLLKVLLPYFKTGLKNNECCLWILPDTLSSEEGRKLLRKHLPVFQERFDNGQLQILPSAQISGNTLEKTVLAILDSAVSKGFDGLRLACHPLSGKKDFSSRLIEIIDRYNTIGFFAFAREKFDATSLMEVVSRHSYALIRNAGKWELIASSEARIAKDALKKSEQKLQTLFHNMSEGFAYHRIVINEGGKPCDYVFLEANEAFERLTGLSAGSIVGKRATEALPGIESDPTDWIGKYGQVALTGKPIHFESHSAQLRKWYSVSAFSPYKGFFAVTFSDISERKQVEEQLRRAHDELDQKVRERTEELRKANSTLRMISECNQILVHANDEKGLMDEICRIIVEMGGYRMAWVGYAENDAGKTVRPVASKGLSQDYLDGVNVSWDDVPRGRGPTGMCIRTGSVQLGRNFAENTALAPWRDEALKHGFQSSIALPLILGEKAFGALTIYSESPGAFEESEALLRELADDLAFGIMNIRARADRDQARQSAEKRAAQLQALAVELVQAEQKERRRLARILHDHLQQILVGARFGASLIRAKTKDKNRDIDQIAGDLISALDEALRASRSLSADLSPPILHEKGLAAGLKWLSRQMQEKHGMAVDLELDENAEPAAEQVRQFLFEAVRELLLNVVKYAKVNRAEVKMHLLKNGDVEITVSDNGIGFDPSKLENTDSTVGGFGLFSIRERLSYLRGHMEIDAAPAQGSRFTLAVPVSLAAPVPETRHAGAEGFQTEISVPSAGKIRILLADDHPVLRHGLMKVLEEQPDIHVVGEVGDGQAAVKMSSELKPDVILMDVSLPLLNGFDATRQVLAENPRIRVIGLSMHEEPDMAATMFKAGASAYLTKGGPIERLIAVIRSCRSEKRSISAGSAR